VSVLVPEDSVDREGLVVTPTHLEWIGKHFGGGSATTNVERIPKSGGTVEVLASSVDNEVYWPWVVSDGNDSFIRSHQGLVHLPVNAPYGVLTDETPHFFTAGLGFVWWVREESGHASALVRLPTR
jgi:hypothetical protein